MPAPKKTILVVEDEVAMNHALHMAFARAGFVVVNCFDGVDAIDRIRQHRFDAVLLDLFMPGLDGFDVLQVKGRTPCAETPFFALTAFFSTERDPSRALVLGARRVFSTTEVSPREIATIVAEALGTEEGTSHGREQ